MPSFIHFKNTEGSKNLNKSLVTQTMPILTPKLDIMQISIHKNLIKLGKNPLKTTQVADKITFVDSNHPSTAGVHICP